MFLEYILYLFILYLYMNFRSIAMSFTLYANNLSYKYEKNSQSDLVAGIQILLNTDRKIYEIKKSS